MENKTLTIFTPAYNRAHTIHRTYESLCRQTSKDFCWLVVDDGSIDNTKELVEGWIKECRILIRYVYQENQGMHGAHNTAYRYIDTELNTCIDSDDYMPDDAVEKIIAFWAKNKSDKYAGIIGLDAIEGGSILGSMFPEQLRSTTLGNYYKSGGRGDKKLVYRTEIIKATPEYPIFSGEKYVGLGYKYQLIDQKYELLTLNEPLVIVDYQTDGSSMNMYKQYWNNPRGFAFMRKNDMIYSTSLKRKYESCVHYVSNSLRSRNSKMLKESPLPFLTFMAILPGLCLYLFTKYKVSRNSLKSIR